MKKLYLAHPFPTRKRMRQWELRTEHRTGVELLNPFYDGHGEEVMKKIDSGQMTHHDYSKFLTPKMIVEQDLKAIKSCEGVVAYVDGSASIGTFMEIWLASQQYKLPVYIIIESRYGKEHPWLVYCATQTFDTLTSFTRWLGKQAKKKK